MTLCRANGIGLEVAPTGRRSGAPGAGTGPVPETDRPVVVGLHGLVLDDLSGFYFTVGGALREVADPVLYDLRGHGRSEFTPGGYSLATMTADLFALLDTLGHDGPVHLLGNSYGGAIAITAAHAHPERVASVIMLEGHYPRAGWGAEMELTMALVAERLNPDYVMAELQISSRRKAERVAERADQLINRSSLRADLLAEPVLDDAALAALACPVLCLYGTDSDLAERGRHLAGVLPAAELVMFEGATHSLLTERTPELRPLLADWIVRNPPVAAEPVEASPVAARP